MDDATLQVLTELEQAMTELMKAVEPDVKNRTQGADRRLSTVRRILEQERAENSRRRVEEAERQRPATEEIGTPEDD